jgi:capsular polysaccharide biosynthesis protein
VEIIETSSKWLNASNLWLVDKAPFGPVHPEDLARVRGFVSHVAPQNSELATKAKTKVYVSRSGYLRSMKNEFELENWLEGKGFTIFKPDRVENLLAQINVFRNADLVVGATGSGLANCMFSPPGGTVVELFSDFIFDNSETVVFFSSINVDLKRVFMNATEESPYGDAEFAIQRLRESGLVQ